MSTNHPLAEMNALGRDALEGQTLYLNEPMQAYRLDTLMDGLFDVDRVRMVEVGSIDEAYMKVLSECGLSISNAFDPVLRNNPLYRCCQVPDGRCGPEKFHYPAANMGHSP